MRLQRLLYSYQISMNLRFVDLRSNRCVYPRTLVEQDIKFLDHPVVKHPDDSPILHWFVICSALQKCMYRVTYPNYKTKISPMEYPLYPPASSLVNFSKKKVGKTITHSPMMIASDCCMQNNNVQSTVYFHW